MYRLTTTVHIHVRVPFFFMQEQTYTRRIYELHSIFMYTVVDLVLSFTLANHIFYKAIHLNSVTKHI